MTENYIGFFYTGHAIYLAARQPQRLLLITKRLYPEVAKRCATTWQCVERGIRLAIDIVWKTNPELLEELAHHPLEKKPTASTFLAILSAYFEEEP